VNHNAILLMYCPDQKGLVAAVTDFLYKNNGNILDLEQYVDKDNSIFFMRVEWDLKYFGIERDKIDDYFGTLIGKKYQMTWTLHFTDQLPRMAIFVSKAAHCLYDILSRYQSGEWEVEIPLIISNHSDLKRVADNFKIRFYHFSMKANNKQEVENEQLKLLAEEKINFVVLARYMQIISKDFIAHYPNRVINIHHSFLPAFIGAKPYHQAYSRGVKIIGATSHYVTEDLDAGPIIAQDVTQISHKESIDDLVMKGKDLEKMVLSKAIFLHLQHKILSYKGKTVIFH